MKVYERDGNTKPKLEAILLTIVLKPARVSLACYFCRKSKLCAVFYLPYYACKGAE